MNYIMMWPDIKEQQKEAYKDLDTFFERLYKNEDEHLTSVGIAYRESQHKFASTIMEAIRDGEILLIEAGVGTGKSLGYLIPIFHTMDNVTVFDKVIISTSTITLQEQLLDDVNYVSKILNMNIKAWISKGINNYACIKRIERKLLSSRSHNDDKVYEVLKALKQEMYSKGTCDKAHLPNINGDLWQEIRVCGGCENCSVRSKCLFVQEEMHVHNMPIVITNHTQFSNMIKHNDAAFTSSSLIVVDEAHKLEEQIRLANEETFSFSHCIDLVKEIKLFLEMQEDYDTSYELTKLRPLINEIKGAILTLAIAVRSNTRTLYGKQGNKERYAIEDCDKLTFDICNKRVQSAASELLISLNKLINILSPVKGIKGINKYLNELNKIRQVVQDILLMRHSKNIYWVRFVSKEKIELKYTIKDLKPYFDKMFERGKPVVFTSATLTTNNDYEHFIKSNGLTENDRLFKEFPIASPFDYEKNTLFYYDDEMVHPNSADQNEYIIRLAIKIRDLIEITEGKALILFTSKSDMYAVYNMVSKMGLKEKLILQNNDDFAKCKEEFESENNSCLFATGAFWEGVDFPGKTLSNLIIARLPFPVQDPIVEYKRENAGEDTFKVDFNEMLMKLKQGTGRLIRSVNDTGVVCCLDSRTPKYLEDIKRSLPFKTYTNDLNELIEFSKEKILERDDGVKTLSLRPKN